MPAKFASNRAYPIDWQHTSLLYDDHVNVDMYHFNMFIMDKRPVYMCDHVANYIKFINRGIRNGIY